MSAQTKENAEFNKALKIIKKNPILGSYLDDMEISLEEAAIDPDYQTVCILLVAGFEMGRAIGERN